MNGKQLRTRLRKAGKETGRCIHKVAWYTCKCILYSLCAPCLCAALQRTRTCARRAAFKEYVQPDFPAPRPRALSLPLIEAQENQRTTDQLQSAFITKLPLELRRMIYAETLGGVSIHLMTYNGKPSAKRCSLERTFQCNCNFFNPLQEKKLMFGLALLRTCRTIYSEAVGYLYSANSFSLTTDRDEIPTIDYLSYYFLPQRLVQIPDLRIHWQLDSMSYYSIEGLPEPRLAPWLKSWEALSRLKGLRRLHINLECSYWTPLHEETWRQKGAQFLAPAKEITASREFVIVLPHWQCTTDLEVGNARCVLKTRPGLPESSIIP